MISKKLWYGERYIITDYDECGVMSAKQNVKVYTSNKRDLRILIRTDCINMNQKLSINIYIVKHNGGEIGQEKIKKHENMWKADETKKHATHKKGWNVALKI